MSSEYILEQTILEYLASSGAGFFWKNTSGGFFDGKKMRKHASPFAINGTSDILGVLNGGQFIAIEVKTTTTTTPQQDAFIKKVRALGGHAIVARSCDQVKQYIEGLTPTV